MAIKRIKKDDRYDISRRNEISRTSNRNQVSANNEYTENSRRVFEKLANLATKIAEHFDWDPSLVFEDFVKDLALINDPTLRNNLDPNNPVDVMTGQLFDMYTEDPEAFNIFRNQAVSQIMNMSEDRAIAMLEQYFGNRLGGGSQLLEGNNRYRRIENNNDSCVSDSKEDEQRFIEKFGQKAFDRYNRIKQKLVSTTEKDITWITANVTPEDLNEIFNTAEFYGYEPAAENEEFVMFDVDNLEMCQKLSRGTNWCIAVPTAWNQNTAFGAKFKVFVNKNTGDKYCLVDLKGTYEIVDKNDKELAKLPDGVPAYADVRSSVVQEDTSSEEALLMTALANIQLLPVDTLRIAYDDLFGEELDMLNDDEVKEWLSNQIQQLDRNELKRYIENHLNDFAVVPTEDEIEEAELEEVEPE